MSTPDIQVYRAIIQSADPATGTLQVTIPALMGAGVRVPVSNVGFSQNAFGQYLVPAAGTNGFVAVQSGYQHAYWVAEPAVTQAFVVNQAQLYAASAGSAASAGAITAASVSLVAHVNAADPHPQYLTPTELLTTGYPLGRRNLLDNGDFAVAQRGTGLRFATSGIYTADRWYAEPITGRNTAFYPQTGNGVYNRRFTHVVDVGGSGPYTPTGAEFCRVRQQISGERAAALQWGTANAQPLTVSFECSTTAGFNALAVGIESRGRVISALVDLTTGSGLSTRRSVTFPGDTGGSTITPDNNAAVYVIFWLAAGSNYTSTPLGTTWSTTGTGRATGTGNIYSAAFQQFYLSQVQAEIGSVATPYEVVPFGAELAECRRYYWRWDMANANSTISVGQAYAANQVIHAIRFPVAMRAIPGTFGNSPAGNFSQQSATAVGQACTAISWISATQESTYMITTTAGGLVAGNASALVLATVPSYVEISADL